MKPIPLRFVEAAGSVFLTSLLQDRRYLIPGRRRRGEPVKGDRFLKIRNQLCL